MDLELAERPMTYIHHIGFMGCMIPELCRPMVEFEVGAASQIDSDPTEEKEKEVRI